MNDVQLETFLPPGAQPEIDREKFEEKVSKRSSYMRQYLRDKTKIGSRFLYGGPASRSGDKAYIDVWPIRPITLKGIIVGGDGMSYSVADDAGMEFRVNITDWMDRAELTDRPLNLK